MRNAINVAIVGFFTLLAIAFTVYLFIERSYLYASSALLISIASIWALIRVIKMQTKTAVKKEHLLSLALKAGGLVAVLHTCINFLKLDTQYQGAQLIAYTLGALIVNFFIWFFIAAIVIYIYRTLKKV